MTEKTPEDFLETVTNQATFIEFLMLLRRDFQSAGQAEPGWENLSLPDYLEACAAYGVDKRSVEADAMDAAAAAWRIAAEILLAGKYYE